MKKPKYELFYTKSFRHDIKLLKKRGYDLSRLQSVVFALQCGETLDPIYKDHPLKGDKTGLRDCHIQDDWVLLYRIKNDRLILTLYRTGTHSDLDL